MRTPLREFNGDPPLGLSVVDEGVLVVIRRGLVGRGEAVSGGINIVVVNSRFGVTVGVAAKDEDDMKITSDVSIIVADDSVITEEGIKY